MERSDRILGYAATSPTRHRRRATAVVAAAMLACYLGGYAAFRTRGIVLPGCDVVRLPPILFVFTQSPTDRLLYQLYRPCIAAENWYRANHIG